MTQYIVKHSIYIIIAAALAFVMTLAGCTDDPLYNEVEIPDAEVELRGEVIFRPLVSTEVQTQSRSEAPDGEEYKGIKSLYLFFFNAEREKIPVYCGEVSFTPVPSEGSTHEHVTFRKKVKSGKYYVYAVANIPAVRMSELEKVTSIVDLRNFKLNWDGNIGNDLEMFGVFQQNYNNETGSAPDNEKFEDDILLTITPAKDKIHSWVRRAVSKVTVDFDGTNLKDGVTVYIKNAVLKDVASGAFLGTKTAVGVDNDFTCTTSDYSINYGEGEDHTQWLAVTKTSTVTPPTDWNVTSFHDDAAKALPCYENMQGTPEGSSKKVQDSNGDGIIDSQEKDGVGNGTYLEVEGYYVANCPEYKSQGKIIYRFMLGKNATNNFDVVRNHHYKITMNFKDYGNDIDWHIDYREKYLDVTYPKDVNYKGEFFVPAPGEEYSTLHNMGHTLEKNNVITVTSYVANNDMDADGNICNQWIEPEITYTYYAYNDKTGGWDVDNSTPGWLTTTEGVLSTDKTQKQYTFVASMAEPTESTINDLFPETAVPGSNASPYNLSNKNGESTVENTANCYMVGAPGWYCFPLVYGNAITDGKTNSTAYSSENMKNHVNQKINAPYIKDHVVSVENGVEKKLDLSNVSVKLIWQDAKKDDQYLIEPTSIEYVSTLFGDSNGWIRFQIGKIQEGNAVIALIDNNAKDDEYVYFDRKDEELNTNVYGTIGSTKAIWSWHIWATRFGSEDFEKDIRITNHDEKTFDVMPVNLGWCSGGKEIKYYKRRKCDITFKVGEGEHERITRTIVQYPHFVLPRGDHPYYQWGRKDPFVGSNALWQNKKRWTYDGTTVVEYDVWSQYNPPRLYKDYATQFNGNKERKSTNECLDVLVKNPDKWLNAKRKENPGSTSEYDKFLSDNDAPGDLWSIGGEKTVYDPCPAGYHVSDKSVFTGFTFLGGKAKFPVDWYDVLEKNMEQGFYPTNISVNRQVLELYTDTRRVQSITFPVSGYRDYDAKAQIVQYPDITNNVWGQGFVWFNEAYDKTNSYHFKYHRNDIKGTDELLGWKDRGSGADDNLIGPDEYFYNTDGFGIRPVRIKTK